jgi:DNA-binding transcriptional ArsR family regulator
MARELLPTEYVLNDLEQLQAIADPLRLRLLELLSQKAMTVTQVANALGEKPNRLYYHINKLEQVGLVRLVETRPYRGILEKYYQAVAEEFKTDESLLRLREETQETTESLYQAMRAVFETTLKDFRQTLMVKGQEAEEESTGRAARVHGILNRARLRWEKAREFSEKVAALCEEFGAADEPEGDVEYNLTLALFPLAKARQESPEEEEGT